jgi:hypothetical protein
LLERHELTKALFKGHCHTNWSDKRGPCANDIR